jgi:hypothetical protein
MTEQRLPELLRELAEPVGASGLSERAWQRAQLIRRRRRASVGAVAAVTLTVGALTVVRSYGPDPGLGPGPGLGDQTGPATSGDPPTSVSAVPSPAPRIKPTPPAATVAGAPTWLSPRPEDERALPVMPSVLPANIDLTRPAPLLRDKPLPRAVAAYLLTTLDGKLDRVLVLGTGGGSASALRRVDLGDLEWVPDGQGNSTAPFTRTSLSPDGKRIAFAQEHEIVVLTLADASWQRFPVRGVNTDLFQWFSDDMIFSGDGPAVDVRTGESSEVDYEP